METVDALIACRCDSSGGVVTYPSDVGRFVGKRAEIITSVAMEYAAVA